MSEVSEITQIRPHILRQWEVKYAFLRPAKSQSGRKLYKPDDLELIRKIKQLQKQGYSDYIIQQLLHPAGNVSESETHMIVKDHKPTFIREMIQELNEILALLK